MVRAYMAHHQGMTIVALANAMFDGTPRRWAMHDARLSAVSSLLQERVPREVSRLLEPPPGTLHTPTFDPDEGAIEVGLRAATRLIVDALRSR